MVVIEEVDEFPVASANGGVGDGAFGVVVGVVEVDGGTGEFGLWVFEEGCE